MSTKYPVTGNLTLAQATTELVEIFGTEVWFGNIKESMDDGGYALDMLVDREVWIAEQHDTIPRMYKGVPVRVKPVRVVHPAVILESAPEEEIELVAEDPIGDVIPGEDNKDDKSSKQ